MTPTSILRLSGDRVLLDVKAVPSASRTEIVDIKDGRLRIRIAAAPEDGKANAELRSALAKAAGCAKSAVELVSGEKSRLKTLAFPRECEPALRILVASMEN
jgi:uncharacterized protein (TIGR00251 family)